MKRKSPFLSICAVIAVLLALQCWIVPHVYGFDSTNWKVAWCESTSPLFDWSLLYAWTATVIPIVYFAIKRCERAAYISTIGSFCVFWLFAYCANRSVFGSDEFYILGGFLGLMLWRLRTISSEELESNQSPQRTPTATRPAPLS